MRKNKANYGFAEIVGNAYSLIYTKLFWKSARLVRRPCYIRGKKAIQYGKGFTTGRYCRIEINGDLDKTKLNIGNNCVIGDYAHIVANKCVNIGNDVLFASRVFITDTNHGSYSGLSQSHPEEAPNDRHLSCDKVVIGDGVWLGENVVILPGVTIGEGCVIGSNSVVTKDIPKECIAVGSPAVVIKMWDPQNEKWVRV